MANPQSGGGREEGAPEGEAMNASELKEARRATAIVARNLMLTALSPRAPGPTRAAAGLAGLLLAWAVVESRTLEPEPTDRGTLKRAKNDRL